MMARRDDLIDTACELFNRYGYHATGIDRILEESGVAKRTLYHHFHSKDDLILAVLKQYDQKFREWFTTEVEKKAKTPHERLLAIFDVAHQWFRQHQFHGCMFIHAAGEFPDENSEIRKFCKKSKQMLRNYIQNIVNEIGANNPKQLAKQLALLLDGAIVTAHVTKNPNASKVGKEAAKILIHNALIS